MSNRRPPADPAENTIKSFTIEAETGEAVIRIKLAEPKQSDSGKFVFLSQSNQWEETSCILANGAPIRMTFALGFRKSDIPLASAVNPPAATSPAAAAVTA